MTTAQVCKHLDRQATECLDSYVLMGFHAVTGEGIIMVHADTAKDSSALNKLLIDLVASGGVVTPNEGGHAG